jgi:LysR family glycine cleavage system transcriptional activator
MAGPIKSQSLPGLRLPPLNALRAFEAAARHSSFTRAAGELCVTPGAVSRHVRKLEQSLGASLFNRGAGQVELTAEGIVYLAQIRTAFEQISEATAAARSHGANERLLRIHVPPTCAARWLVPRLVHFHADHPDISIQLTTSHDPVDFARDDVDAAIQYGPGVPSSLEGQALFPEVLLPVCSPRLAGRAPRVRAPHDLVGHVLLHSIRRPNDWPDWLSAAGVRGPSPDRTLAFENSTLTYEGAVEGLGVAVAQLAFVHDEIERGRLVAPIDVRLRSAAAYCLVFPAHKRAMRKVRAFAGWACREASMTRCVLD